VRRNNVQLKNHGREHKKITGCKDKPVRQCKRFAFFDEAIFPLMVGRWSFSVLSTNDQRPTH